MGVMKEREEHIGSEIDAAEESRAQAEQLLAEQKVFYNKLVWNLKQ